MFPFIAAGMTLAAVAADHVARRRASQRRRALRAGMVRPTEVVRFAPHQEARTNSSASSPPPTSAPKAPEVPIFRAEAAPQAASILPGEPSPRQAAPAFRAERPPVQAQVALRGPGLPVFRAESSQAASILPGEPSPRQAAPVFRAETMPGTSAKRDEYVPIFRPDDEDLPPVLREALTLL